MKFFTLNSMIVIFVTNFTWKNDPNISLYIWGQGHCLLCNCLLCTGDISVSLDSTGPRPRSRSQTRLLRLYRRLHRPALTWPVHNIIISELNIAQWAQYSGRLQVVLHTRSCRHAPRQSSSEFNDKNI